MRLRIKQSAERRLLARSTKVARRLCAACVFRAFGDLPDLISSKQRRTRSSRPGNCRSAAIPVRRSACGSAPLKLAGLDRIGDRLVHFRRDARLASASGKDLILEHFHRAGAIAAGSGPFVQGGFARRNVALGFGTPVDHSLDRVLLHRTERPGAEFRGFLRILAFGVGNERPSAQNAFGGTAGRHG